MTLIISSQHCKGCGICVSFCPKEILALDENAKIYIKELEKCILCGQCEIRCPDFCMKVIKD